MKTQHKVFWKAKLLIVCLVWGLSFSLQAKVKLPALVSDGMVLQRDQRLNIWGQADPGEMVTLVFRDKTYQTKADQKGDWTIVLPEMKAGGPFVMKVNEITLSQVYVGDVWVASGQSNMELPMSRVRLLYPDELKMADSEYIRFFTVPLSYNFKGPQDQLTGGKWEAANPKTISHFSAVAYFFAKALSAKTKIPVGIIQNAVGGAPIQAWMGMDALKNYPDYVKEAKLWQNDDLIKSTEEKDKNQSSNWIHELDHADLGLKQDWKNPDTNTSDWQDFTIPGTWQKSGQPFYGTLWFERQFSLPKGSAGKTAFLNLGRIKDADETFINGVKVGQVTYEYPPRWYSVPEGVLKEGQNTITARVTDNSGRGEFVQDKPYYLEVDGKKYDLKGVWKYKIGGEINRPTPSQTFIRWKPTGLYNAMLHPLIRYGVQGVIWYQGESNTAKPYQYQDLLTTLIREWRADWKDPQMPFLMVQLANFMTAPTEPVPSNWAALRDQQRRVSLSVPRTGMAVITDLGEWNDIHPLRKKEVGERLALQAEKMLYDSELVADGPVYQSVKFEGNKAILNFKPGTDDFQKVPELKGFAIKGEDGNWVWAKAQIQGKKILVWNDNIAKPVAVRYAWADNPKQANLKNTNGLPASVFTTENESNEK